VYEELPARRALSFEPESPPILPEEHDFPVMIDPETLGAEVLTERLNNLRIIEEIEGLPGALTPKKAEASCGGPLMAREVSQSTNWPSQYDSRLDETPGHLVAVSLDRNCRRNNGPGPQ
jgi:hypothetical protein